MGRFSIVLPDETIATIRERADAAGISQTEWTRRAVLEACTPGAPSDTPPDTGARVADLTAAIAAAEAEADQARAEAVTAQETAETATADRDALAIRVQVLEAEAKKDAEHIRSLQSAIATVAAGARPALDTIADQDQGRPGILASARDRVRSWLSR